MSIDNETHADVVRRLAPAEGAAPRMLPAEAYTSPAVHAWEARNLFAGTWTCLGRLDELLPRDGGARPVRQRAAVVGDVGVVLVRDGDEVRMFANTCRHRGHELLGDGGSSDKQRIMCPYHAWTYDLSGALVGAPGFRDDATFEPSAHGLAELPVQVWGGWVFGHGVHAKGSEQAPSFEEHLGDLAGIVAPYAPETLVVADRHSYEIAANWKAIAENYHECYHCPLIHPELCQVTPPDSGLNYDLPGAWVGGSMDLRDEARTMSMTGELAAEPLPGVNPRTVEYVHLMPNLLISAHPDYVMTHRMVPLAADRTWLECTWLVRPAADGSVPDAAGAVEFWDLTNRQDWAACESVQRGLTNPHFQPGPFAAREDAVGQLIALVAAAYRSA